MSNMDRTFIDDEGSCVHQHGSKVRPERISPEELQKPAPVRAPQCWHLLSASQTERLKGEFALLWNLWEVRVLDSRWAFWNVEKAMLTPSQVPTNPIGPMTTLRGCHQKCKKPGSNQFSKGTVQVPSCAMIKQERRGNFC